MVQRKIKIIFIILICFSFLFYVLPTTSQAFGPSDDVLYEGIDVSNYQGEIDFKKVKEDGIEVVYIKASQGSNIKDPYFDINYENAKANGLKVGFYHFLTATNTRRSRATSTIFCFCYSR